MNPPSKTVNLKSEPQASIPPCQLWATLTTNQRQSVQQAFLSVALQWLAPLTTTPLCEDPSDGCH